MGHLMYGPLLANTVPSWMPDHVFWVYFTGAALVGAGIAVILGIRIRVVSLLLALMIFFWFWMVHIPGAVKRPLIDRGNLVASASDALAFSGIALLIAFTMKSQKWVEDINNYGE